MEDHLVSARSVEACPFSKSLTDPDIQSDPYDFYAKLHHESPIYKDPDTNVYIFTRYDDIRSAMNDTSTFSNVLNRTDVLKKGNGDFYGNLLAERGWARTPTLNLTDPPEHNRMRNLVDRFLNVREVKARVPRMQQLAHSLIDRFIDAGECDFPQAFGFPFPGTIIAEIVGFRAEDWPQYRRWAETLMSHLSRALSEDEIRAAVEIEVEMQQAYAAMLTARRSAPREDLITALLHQDEGERPLTMGEMQDMMHQFTTGGYETVASSLCHGIWQLIRFPEIAEELNADRSLIPNFVFESLRWESPAQGVYRRTTREVRVGGTIIPEGATCMMRLAAGNRDPEKFPAPGDFDIHRRNAGSQFCWGVGPHTCVGATLARQELIVAYNAILDRVTNIRLVKPMPYPVHHPSYFVITLKELKITFDKIR